MTVHREQAPCGLEERLDILANSEATLKAQLYSNLVTRVEVSALHASING